MLTYTISWPTTTVKNLTDVAGNAIFFFSTQAQFYSKISKQDLDKEKLKVWCKNTMKIFKSKVNYPYIYSSQNLFKTFLINEKKGKLSLA